MAEQEQQVRRKRGKPRQFDARIRNMPLPQEVKTKVLAIAKREQVSVSQVVREALSEYVTDKA